MEKLRLSEESLREQLTHLKKRVENGEIKNPESAKKELAVLGKRFGGNFDSVWTSGDSSIDSEINAIREILPYIHLGQEGIFLFRRIQRLRYNKNRWGPKVILKIIIDIDKSIEKNGWDYEDFGITDEWLDNIYRESAISTGRSMLKGIMSSKKNARSRADGMESLRNFLAKNDLTMDDVKPELKVIE